MSFDYDFTVDPIPRDLFNNILTWVQVMAWRRSEDKSLFEPIMISLLMDICVTRPQIVKYNYSMPSQELFLFDIRSSENPLLMSPISPISSKLCLNKIIYIKMCNLRSQITSLTYYISIYDHIKGNSEYPALELSPWQRWTTASDCSRKMAHSTQIRCTLW